MQKADVEGKIALVTGSSGGVGLRVAEALARGRATVVVNSRSQENGKRTVDHLTGISDKVHLAVGDCENYDAAAEVARQASGVTGGIDILVSAGAASRILPRPFAEMTGTELVDAFQSRLFPRIFPVHAALPYMRERGGTVVMLCTDAARHATAGESIPGAVGASIILMTKVFAKEFARWRIRVTGQSAQVTGQTISVNGGLSFGGW